MANKMFLRFKWHRQQVNKKNLLLISNWMIFMFCLFVPTVYAGEMSLEQMKSQREATRTWFFKYAHQVRDCQETIDLFPSAIEGIRKTIEKRGEACKSPIFTHERYNRCIRLTRQIISNISSLKRTLFGQHKPCIFLSTSMELNKQLQDMLVSLSMNLDYIGYEGIGKWISISQHANEEVHKYLKPFNCGMNILNFAESIPISRMFADFAYQGGDIYVLNKAISQLSIAKDYVTIMYNTCEEKSFDLPQKPAFREVAQKRIERIKKNIQYIESIIDPIIKSPDHRDFDELSQKLCKQIKEVDLYGLCEKPMNTPAWTYSAHLVLKSKNQQ